VTDSHHTAPGSGSLLTPAGDVPRPASDAPTVPAPQNPPPSPHVTASTSVNMRYRQIDADGKVTQIDVDPKAAKRVFYGGIALLVISAILIFAATLMLINRVFG
jgi:hypothetical protein